MNAFYDHHNDGIRLGYRCFDRLLLNGLIQPFQQPERVIGFLNTYRQQYPVSRDVLRETATQFPNWVVNRSRKWDAPILEAPEERRDKFLDPYFRKAKPSQVVAVVKGREPARIMIAIGNKKENRWHLDIAQRWVVQMQYNFYVHDEHWGRMFVRMCPYLPFSARVCLNQHHWLAVRMREEGIEFQQCTNAFLKCSNPAHLQELAGSLRARDLLNCGQKWLATFTPFFTERERKQAGCQHRLFFAQVELCDNLIFRRRAALDQMGERLLDGNRTIGQRGRRMPVENDSYGPRGPENPRNSCSHHSMSVCRHCRRTGGGWRTLPMSLGNPRYTCGLFQMGERNARSQRMTATTRCGRRTARNCFFYRIGNERS